jgi:hypothetical protein
MQLDQWQRGWAARSLIYRQTQRLPSAWKGRCRCEGGSSAKYALGSARIGVSETDKAGKIT